MKFLRYLLIELTNKYGSFIWFGTHVSMTQTDWHWILESFLCLFVNIIIIFSLYLQYKDLEDGKR
jgi:hypothetical protein